MLPGHTFGFQADGITRRIRDGYGMERGIRVAAVVTASSMDIGVLAEDTVAEDAVVQDAAVADDNPLSFQDRKNAPANVAGAFWFMVGKVNAIVPNGLMRRGQWHWPIAGNERLMLFGMG